MQLALSTNDPNVPATIKNDAEHALRAIDGVRTAKVLIDIREAVSRVLLDAAEDSSFLSRIAHAGADVVRENFDLRKRTQRLEEIYLKLL